MGWKLSSLNALPLKLTPVAADTIEIADSADSFRPKRATLGSLPGGGGGGGGGAIGSTLKQRQAQLGALVQVVLDDTSGTTATDYRAGVNGTINGSPLLNQTGIVDGVVCADFDGTDDEIRFPDAWDAGLPAASVNIVCEPDNLTGKKVLFKLGGANNGYSVGLDGNKLVAASYTTSTVRGGVTGTTSLSVDSVYHVGAVWSSLGYVAIFLNGALEGIGVSAAHFNNSHTGTSQGCIGAARDSDGPSGARFPDGTTSNTAWFDGKLSHFAWWNRALADWEFKALYDGTVL